MNLRAPSISPLCIEGENPLCAGVITGLMCLIKPLAAIEILRSASGTQIFFFLGF